MGRNLLPRLKLHQLLEAGDPVHYNGLTQHRDKLLSSGCRKARWADEDIAGFAGPERQGVQIGQTRGQQRIRIHGVAEVGATHLIPAALHVKTDLQFFVSIIELQYFNVAQSVGTQATKLSRDLVGNGKRTVAVRILCQRDRETILRCIVTNNVVVFPGVAWVGAIGTAVNCVIALARFNEITATTGLDGVVAGTRAHIVFANLAACQFACSGIDVVSPVGTVPIRTYNRQGIDARHRVHNPVLIRGGNYLKVPLAVGKSKNLNVGQDINAITTGKFGIGDCVIDTIRNPGNSA